MDKIILHADLNSFFASVELLFHPELKGVPMAVAGDAEQRRGIILAKNDLAKACGVKTAETIWQARKKCPNLHLVSPNYDRYLHYSELAREIFCRLTDRVESFGLDEAWLDVTHSTALFGDGPAMADWLRQQMKTELGLTCSVGVSFTKVFAKLGSDMKKPDATTVITRENYKKLVWPLPTGQLLFVGAATERRLQKLGIRTIGDLARSDPKLLLQLLGRHGPALWLEANGQGDNEVSFKFAEHQIKSVSNSTTTPHDLTTNEMVKAVLYQLSDQVASRLREKHLKGKTLQISIRDNQFRTIDRQMQLPEATDLAADIAPLAMNLFIAQYTWENPIRNLGIRMTDLIGEFDLQQMTLQDLPVHETGKDQLPASKEQPTQRKKQQKLEQTLDELRERFGRKQIGRGITIEKPENREEKE